MSHLLRGKKSRAFVYHIEDLGDNRLGVKYTQYIVKTKNDSTVKEDT